MKKIQKEIDNAVIEASEAERERIFTLINYILNKNSKPSGIDYKKAYEDMEELEHYLSE